jgi:putative sigma-54 modulation protein
MPERPPSYNSEEVRTYSGHVQLRTAGGLSLKGATLELTFVAKNTTLTEAMKEYAAKRLGKLDRRFRESVPVQLEIRKEGTRREDQRYVAQVTVRLKGGLIRSEERGPTPYAAIDVVESTLDGRIQRYKTQFERRRRQATRFERTLAEQIAEMTEPAEAAAEALARSTEVVRTKKHAVSPMSVEEAAAQMDLLGHDFYVFLNRESNGINVVYRRDDGGFGLIVPEVQG